MKALKIAHLFPDLLNLYGDGGNVRCLEKRCQWRDIPVEVRAVRHGESFDFSETDVVFLGGGPDREQKLASEQLLEMRNALADYVEAEGVLLAICGGFQLLGNEWLLGPESVKGLEIIDMVTKRAEEQEKRLVGDVVLQSEVSNSLIVGYENHAGRTFLGAGMKPFGKIVSSTGAGNNGTDKQDGVLYKHVLGTYLHGPLLGKNPSIADTLLQWVSQTREAKGEEGFTLDKLDDSVEQEANDFMLQRLGLA